MKGKYYPRSSILEASCGNRPSYAWRSIQGSCGLLKVGLIWRIGNGNKVKIWGEKWLPKPTTYTVQSPPNTLNRESLVCDLIDPDTRWWNPIILQENFNPEERHLIQSIPIGSAHQQDLQIWRGTNSRIFTVRSAYHLAKKVTTRSKAESSRCNSDSHIWQGIWGPHLANASKNFMWWACHDLLLTRDNLCWREIISDPMCPI
jgi:hypothetical protein